MHRIFLAVAAFSLLASCNQQQPSDAPANPLAVVTLVGWADVATEDINVPQGVSYTPSDVGGARVVEIAGVPDNAVTTQKTGGVSVRMRDDFENQASGRQILITARAYAAQDGARLGMAYSTNDVGNSGWYEFELTRTPADYHFVYNVPAKRAGGGDFLGFRSYGDSAVQVVGFRTAVLPRPPAPPAQRELRGTE
jgi:hypothetical protein